MRKPSFAGTFYPSEKKELLRIVDQFINQASLPPNFAKRSEAYISPHAGYIYSGKTAGYTYRAILGSDAIKKVDTIILVGPNHTGLGDPAKPISVSPDDWMTPLGMATTDTTLSKEICSRSGIMTMDDSAHMQEHSIEVQLPFLHTLFTSKKFVFICMGEQSPESSLSVSNAISKSLEYAEKRAIVIASSDMDHYEPAAVASKKDNALMAKIKVLDAEGFNKIVEEVGDTACGYGPITVAMLCAKNRGATKGTMLNYSNSGDATGDNSSVVAYLSAAFD